MKKLLLLLSLTFIPVLNAQTYYDYEKVEVEELPTASAETINKVYVKGKSYYVTESTTLDGSPTYLQLGVNYKGQRIYFDYKNPFVEFAYSNCSNCVWMTFDSFYFNGNLNKYGTMYKNTLTPLIDSFYDVVGVNLPVGNTGYYLSVKDSYYIISFVSTKDFIIKSYDSSSTFAAFELDKLFSTTPFYQETTYSWKEVRKSDMYEITVKDDDFYFFFSYNDISNFNILSSYDFSNFTDFEKIVIVLGFNIFFLMFLGFIVYIFIKLVNKGITLLFR